MTDPVLESGYRFLRGTSTGDLRFDENFRPIRFVIAPDGRLVAPVMVAMLLAVETVLFIPEYVEGSLELLVTLLPFEEQGEAGALADRWRIYHGEPEDVRWAFIDVETARQGEIVMDGEALMQPNPLAKVEPQLCREMNSRRDELRAICARFGPVEVEDPTMVGIDPLGIDVRRKFDIARVESPEPMPDLETAQRVLERMRSEA